MKMPPEVGDFLSAALRSHHGDFDVTLEPASIRLRWKRFGVIRALLYESELSDF